MLDQYVIGQEDAKRALSVAVYNHYKRIDAAPATGDVELQKSNILMVGPHRLRQNVSCTDAGKAFARALRHRRRHQPHRSGLCRRGCGKHPPAPDSERGLRYPAGAARHHLYRRNRQDCPQEREPLHHPRRERRGRAADAFERFWRAPSPACRPRGGRKHPHQEFIQIDTTNILFICGGAFDGLAPIIENRIGKKALGFGSELKSKQEENINATLKQLRPEDLIKFGLIPEFVGRLPIVVTLDQLDEDQLVRILTEPKNALVRQYSYLMDLDGVELKFEPRALTHIAKQAIERKSGARGLRAIVEGF